MDIATKALELRREGLTYAAIGKRLGGLSRQRIHQLLNGGAEYDAYKHAKDRCENLKHPAWKYYGGRGIEFHFADFDAFLAELGRKPTPEHTLDRYPDRNGHYKPGNVRWATTQEQIDNRNTRRGYIWQLGNSWYGRWVEHEIRSNRTVRRQKSRKLAEVCDKYRTREDVQPLMDAILDSRRKP